MADGMSDFLARLKARIARGESTAGEDVARAERELRAERAKKPRAAALPSTARHSEVLFEVRQPGESPRSTPMARSIPPPPPEVALKLAAMREAQAQKLVRQDAARAERLRRAREKRERLTAPQARSAESAAAPRSPLAAPRSPAADITFEVRQPGEPGRGRALPKPPAELLAKLREEHLDPSKATTHLEHERALRRSTALEHWARQPAGERSPTEDRLPTGAKKKAALRALLRGKKGGVYYVSESGRKVYR